MTVALSFLRNFGFFSGTSGVLGALSAGVGSLAGDREVDKERQKDRREREIGGFGEGVAEGGQSLASGFRRGFTGLVNKPLQGAKQAGVGGALPSRAPCAPAHPFCRHDLQWQSQASHWLKHSAIGGTLFGIHV